MRAYLGMVVMMVFSFTIHAQEMVLIPGGKFIMGKNMPGKNIFGPAHQVEIDSFYMDVTEVTNAEYQKFCKETNHRMPEFWNVGTFRSGEKNLDFPVVGINWYDAVEYAKWAGKRLPTEAEWEYAARGGLAENEFPNGNEWTQAPTKNQPGNWENLISPVVSNEPNGFGLYNMGGNVWEWVSDFCSDTYYSQSPGKNPKGPEKGLDRVIRSGSWHSGNMCKKVYYRKGLPESWIDFAVGFRCVKSL